MKVLVGTLKQWVHEFKPSHTKFAAHHEMLFYVPICLFPLLFYQTHSQLHISNNQSQSPTSTHFLLNDD
jgi:hypothetical protein